LAVAHHASALALHDVLLAAAAAVVWRSGTPWDDPNPGETTTVHASVGPGAVDYARPAMVPLPGLGALALAGALLAVACGQALAAETARRDPPFFDAARGRIGAQRLPETGARRAGAPAAGSRRGHGSDDPATPAYAARAKDTYVCDFGCGFEGGFADVSAHESACPRRPSEVDVLLLPDGGFGQF
jgi:hypothetical protein